MIKKVFTIFLLIYSVSALTYVSHQKINEITVYDKITTLDHQVFFSVLMLALFKTNPDEIITINLDSNGGYFDSAFMIAKYIRDARNNGAKIITKVADKNHCFSSCIFIFLAGEDRFAGDESYFLFHDVRFSPLYNPYLWELETLAEARKRYTDTLSSYSQKLIDFLTYAGIFDDPKKSNVLKGKKLYDHFPGIITELY